MVILKHGTKMVVILKLDPSVMKEAYFRGFWLIENLFCFMEKKKLTPIIALFYYIYLSEVKKNDFKFIKYKKNSHSKRNCKKTRRP